MNYIFIFSVLTVGLSGIVAQILLLRELLVSFYGNELTLGVIMANWILAEAIGVFIIGGFSTRFKNKLNVFAILETLFLLTLPAAVYLSRTFKPMLDVTAGETIGLPLIFVSSFLIVLLPGFCHGALFSSCCDISSSYLRDGRRSIGRVYAWETIGTILGALLLTYLFLPQLTVFKIALTISALNVIICLFYLKSTSRQVRYIILGTFFLMLYLLFSGGATNLERMSIARQWQGQDVIASRNSVYGNVTVVKKQEQYTFFYNGLPAITTPYPDINFVQEFANLPLLFHPQPKDILVLGAGAGGIIDQVIRYPVERIDYAELDPLLIDMLKRYPSQITQKEFSDKRVHIANTDARFFLRSTQNKYDVILIGLSRPTDLSVNRLFTQEFFLLAKNRLKPDGILAFSLPGSLTYVSSQLRDLNACILNALNHSGWHVRVIPGDYNMFLASGAQEIQEITPVVIIQRINQRKISPGILLPGYVNYRLDKNTFAWWEKSLEGATAKVNRDFMPFAVFEMLVIWNKQFSPLLSAILEKAGELKLWMIFWGILAITLILAVIMRRRARLILAYSITTTGFFGMLMNLILVFSFQVIYGYLYHKIGLLIGIFMAGIAVGSILITRMEERIKHGLSLFIKFELAIILFTCALAMVINRLAGYPNIATPVFIAMFLVSGALLGAQFSLAAKMYPKDKEEIGAVAGLLYFSDLFGGCLAGILGGVIFLPVLGLFNSCMATIALKISSLVLLLIFAKRLTKAII